MRRLTTPRSLERALETTEAEYGTGSLEVGLILSRLSFLYDVEDEPELANDCDARINSILREFVTHHPEFLPQRIIN